MNLYPYQQKAVNEIRSEYSKGQKSVLFTLATGGGKTFIFSYIAKSASEKQKNVMILVHRVELLRQTSKSLLKLGADHGLINPKYTPNPSKNIQVASVQTVVNRLENLIPPDLIIVDESHHANAGSWRKIIEYFPDALVLGVTATPCRGDGSGLGRQAGGLFDVMVEGPQTADLIEMGFLSKFKAYAPPTLMDLSAVNKNKNDYNRKQLSDAMDKPTITGDAVKHYQKLCSGVPAVAFCVSVKHAEHVARQFRMAGYRAYSVDGTLDDDERNRRLDGLGNGTIDVITSCDLISEGTDIPAIGCAIMLRPTQSLGLYIQQVGRALRLFKGKTHSIILDHVGNIAKHGMPDDRRDWTLDGRKKKKSGPRDEEPDVNIRQCEQCFAVFVPAPVCPECGSVVKIPDKTPKQIEGELKEIQRVEALEKRKEVWQAGDFESLDKIAKERNYKRGWVHNMWMNKKII